MSKAGTDSGTGSEGRRATRAWQDEPDRCVVAACRAGDHAAWAELVERFSALVFSIPRRYGLDATTSEDVAQEVFQIVLQQLDDLRNPDALPKWLMTTTHRVTCEVVRKSRRVASLPPEALERPAPPDDALEVWERQHRVREALRRLGGRCEELLTALHHDRFESYEALAKRLGMPLGSVGPTRIRCLAKLMELLRSDE